MRYFVEIILGGIGGLVVGGLVLRAFAPADTPPPPTMLVFDWPENQRQAASLAVDGKPVTVVPIGPMELRCEPGRHRIVVVRPGFMPLEQQVTLTEGQITRVRLARQENRRTPAPSSPNAGARPWRGDRARGPIQGISGTASAPENPFVEIAPPSLQSTNTNPSRK